MEETIEVKYYRGKSLLPFENLDEQFEDWVSWLKSVEQSLNGSQAARKPTFDLDLPCEDGWRWQDVGGESGEAA